MVAAYALAGGAYSALLCSRSARLGQLVMALAPGVALTFAGIEVLGLHDLTEPFFAQEPRQVALLVLLALAVLHARTGGRAKGSLLVAVAALFVASLAARGFLVVEVVAGAWLAWVASAARPGPAVTTEGRYLRTKTLMLTNT